MPIRDLSDFYGRTGVTVNLNDNKVSVQDVDLSKYWTIDQVKAFVAVEIGRHGRNPHGLTMQQVQAMITAAIAGSGGAAVALTADVLLEAFFTGLFVETGSGELIFNTDTDTWSWKTSATRPTGTVYVKTVRSGSGRTIFVNDDMWRGGVHDVLCDVGGPMVIYDRDDDNFVRFRGVIGAGFRFNPIRTNLELLYRPGGNLTEGFLFALYSDSNRTQKIDGWYYFTDGVNQRNSTLIYISDLPVLTMESDILRPSLRATEVEKKHLKEFEIYNFIGGMSATGEITIP